uniref:Uncharacterized protein n=1 Tax=Romanomermis culicivorax TaxID=13658 RepID=A0A915IKS8_ROMCU
MIAVCVAYVLLRCFRCDFLRNNDSWPNSSNTSLWEKNVALANFYWQSDQIFVWVDVQAFTFADLLIYLANVWFSFYGASCLGLFELAYFIILDYQTSHEIPKNHTTPSLL